jgi:hypothetical protein
MYCGLSSMKWQRCTHWSEVGCDRNGKEGNWGIVYCGGGGGRLFMGGNWVIAGAPWSGMGVVADHGCSVTTLFSWQSSRSWMTHILQAHKVGIKICCTVYIFQQTTELLQNIKMHRTSVRRYRNTVHSYHGQVNGDMCMKIFVRSELLIYWCRFQLYFHSSTSVKNTVLPYLPRWKHTLTLHFTFTCSLLIGLLGLRNLVKGDMCTSFSKLGSWEHETLSFNLCGQKLILGEW